MILSFHPCLTADAQVILGDRSLGPEDLSLVHRAHAILLPQSCPEVLYHACKKSATMIFPNYDHRYSYPGKCGQTRLFEERRWPHPETICWDSIQAFRPLHPFPFLLKRDSIHEGEGVYLIEDPSDMDRALEEIKKKGDPLFLSQEWIPSEGNVLRVVLLGRKTITYWKRPLEAWDRVTTIHRGAQVDAAWKPDLQEKGASLAREISRGSGINLAALDFVLDLTSHDPEPLLLEINYYFGRRGLGGSLRYYRLLCDAAREWLEENGLDADRIGLA